VKFEFGLENLCLLLTLLKHNKYQPIRFCHAFILDQSGLAALFWLRTFTLAVFFTRWRGWAIPSKFDSKFCKNNYSILSKVGHRISETIANWDRFPGLWTSISAEKCYLLRGTYFPSPLKDPLRGSVLYNKSQ